MKKLLCLLFAVLLVCPLIVACSTTETTPSSKDPTAAQSTNGAGTSDTNGQGEVKDPSVVQTTTNETTPDLNPTTTAPTPTPTDTPDPTTSETPDTTDYKNVDTTPFTEQRYYEVKTVDGVKFEYSGTKIRAAKAPEEKFWSIETVEENDGKKSSVFFAGDTNDSGLYADKLLPGGTIKIDRISYPVAAPKTRWKIVNNGDDTYIIVSVANPILAITCDSKGEFSLDVLEKASSFTFNEVSFTSEKYSEWRSEGGNITLRLPIDVVDQIYDRMQRDYAGQDVTEVKQRIYDRMQHFADDSQKTYEALVELTGFVPYKHITIYAYEHQGVMAGVVGGNPNIFVNVDWYVDDMEKMMRRWDDPNGRKDDYNFCVLHEMGHMFDWDRGWNFESEMQTDFKASYVLYKYRNDENGAWAAPAEYSWDKVWTIDTIDTKGFNGLSGGVMTYRSNVIDGIEKIKYKYSIYRSAEMYTSYVKYCEATEGLSGYEGMKRMFHWFQDEGLTAGKMTRAQRFNLFNQKLTEFCGLDIETYMLDHFKKNDWLATIANASDEGKQEKNASGEPTGYYIIERELTPPDEGGEDGN